MDRKQTESAEDWIERVDPDFETATRKLCQMISKVEGSLEDLATMAEYIECFYEDDDPVSNGWIGSDGLP
jgi:hypothetical protein